MPKGGLQEPQRQEGALSISIFFYKIYFLHSKATFFFTSLSIEKAVMRVLYLMLIISLLFFSCTDGPTGFYTNQAYVPIYATAASLDPVSLQEQRPTTNAGKIYAYQNYIFQNEINEGIHIIDNIQPKHPQKIAFLRIPFNTEMAIKDHYLYANYLNDLIVLDLHNPQQPQLVKRIPDAFPAISQKYPPYTGVYFECPDPSKGIVVGWELKTMDKTPNCRR